MTNAIYILQTLMEKSFASTRKAYQSFIDYTNIQGIGIVQYNEIITQLTQLKKGGKNLCVIKNRQTLVASNA